jgi:hypothetical protein
VATLQIDLERVIVIGLFFHLYAQQDDPSSQYQNHQHNQSHQVLAEGWAMSKDGFLILDDVILFTIITFPCEYGCTCQQPPG